MSFFLYDFIYIKSNIHGWSKAFKESTGKVLHNTSSLTFCSEKLSIENITVLKKTKEFIIFIYLLLYINI